MKIKPDPHLTRMENTMWMVVFMVAWIIGCVYTYPIFNIIYRVMNYVFSIIVGTIYGSSISIDGNYQPSGQYVNISDLTSPSLELNPTGTAANVLFYIRMTILTFAIIVLLVKLYYIWSIPDSYYYRRKPSGKYETTENIDDTGDTTPNSTSDNNTYTSDDDYGGETYDQVRTRLQKVINEWMSAETFIGDQSDYIFTAPTLFDVTVPATAQWHNTRDNAMNLLDVYGTDGTTIADSTIVDAVNKAINSWYKAVEFGKKSVGNQLFSKRKRIVSLTDMILYGTDEEAKVAMSKLHDILCQVTYEYNGHNNPLIPSKVTITNRKNMVSLLPNNMRYLLPATQNSITVN